MIYARSIGSEFHEDIVLALTSSELVNPRSIDLQLPDILKPNRVFGLFLFAPVPQVLFLEKAEPARQDLKSELSALN